MAPPASLRTTIRRSRLGFPGTEQETAGVVQEGDVAQQHGRVLPPAQGDAGGRGDGAVDAGEPAVGEDAWPWVRAAARRRGRRPGCRWRSPAPAVRAECCQTRAPTDGPVAAALPASTESRACWAAAPASSQASSQAHGPAAGEVGQVRQVVQRQFGAPAGLVPGDRNGLVQGGRDVGAGQQGATPAGKGWAGRRAPRARSAAPTPGRSAPAAAGTVPPRSARSGRWRRARRAAAGRGRGRTPRRPDRRRARPGPRCAALGSVTGSGRKVQGQRAAAAAR